MNPVLRILSWFYGFGVGLRDFLYDQGLLPSTTVSIPTICVGNLTMGGAGKTPHTEYLVRLLSPHFKVAVLSRGYKRKTHGFLLADENSTAQTIGDEPMQMHQNFPELIVAVAENRVHGIHKLQHLYPDLQVVILDDAYQHRRLCCGYYILLTEADRLYVNDHLFPKGTLRAHKHQSTRASAVIVTKCPDTMRPIDQRVIMNALHLPTFQDLYFSRIRHGELKAVFPECATVPSELKNPLLVVGIAHADRFIENCKQRFGAKAIMDFMDHHAFTPRDYKMMLNHARLAHAPAIVTTQKDAVRMQNDPYLPDEIKTKLFYIPIEVEIEASDNLHNKIIQYVRENLRNR